MKILGISGSTRNGSFNRLVLDRVLQAAASAGATTSAVNLRDFPMPLYDGDLEAEHGIPVEAERLRSLMESHDLLVFATPEYNGSIPAVLKNAIDWISRPTADRPMGSSFRGRRAVLVSAAGGAGTNGITHLRAILERIGMVVLETQMVVSASHTRFDERGRFLEASLEAEAAALGEAIAKAQAVPA